MSLFSNVKKKNKVGKEPISSRRFRLWVQLFLFSCFLAIVFFFLQPSSLVQDWEDRFQSNFYLFESQFEKDPIPRLPIVLVRIDDSSLPAGSPRSPIDRGWLASIVEQIADHEPEVIGFNLLLDRLGDTTADQKLASAITKAGNLILKNDPAAPIDPLFAKAALDSGVVKFHLDSTGTVQSICDHGMGCGRLQAYHQILWKNFLKAQGKEKNASFSTSATSPAWLKINFTESKLGFIALPANELSSLPEHAFKGKLVLVGTGFPDLYPLYSTPLSSQEQFLQEIEILAHVLNTMFKGNEFLEFSLFWQSFLFFLFLSFLSWMMAYRSPFLALGLGVFWLVGGFGIIGVLFVLNHWVFPYVFPSLLLVFFMLAGLSFLLIQEKFFQLETELKLKQAKIDFLTNELNSHHLFNEFSRLSVMIRQNAESAREYLIEFAEMLRFSLKNGDKSKVPVLEQVEYLQSYIRQQELIFESNLVIDFEMEMTSEGDWRKLQIPWQVFFPLVENAVKYTEGFLKGLKKKNQTEPIDPANIYIQLTRSEEFLIFRVQNPFDPESKVASSKTGIKNLQQRLALAYPHQNYNFSSHQEKELWVAKLELPL